MQLSTHRAVVIISGLLTLLVLGAGAFAVGVRNGLVRIASNQPVTSSPQTAGADRGLVASVSVAGDAPEATPPVIDDQAVQTPQEVEDTYNAGEVERRFDAHEGDGDDESHRVRHRSHRRDSDDD